jgi:hypothetical protein
MGWASPAPGGVLHRRQQVDVPAVPLGAPQRRGVHRDRPSPLVGTSRSASQAPTQAVKAMAVQAGQGAADGGRRRHREVVGRLGSGAQRGADHRRGIGGPPGDRGQGPGAGVHRGGGQGRDRRQRMSAATPGWWVRHRGEVGQQVRGFGGLQRGGVIGLGQGGWDGG